MSVFIRRHLFSIIFSILIVWLLSVLIILQTSTSADAPDNIIVINNEYFGATQFITNLLDFTINTTGLGEMGEPVSIDKNNLTRYELENYEQGFHRHEFNEFVSNLISVNRSLPDVRNPECRLINYDSLSLTVSVVMCFHNEAWSTLIRSIHSIINRSPSHLLKEIILVDDFSNMDHLKTKLDNYIRHLKIVRIIRQNKREGLIRSRLAGAKVVTSDVIVFLDSHIEVTDGWLEPLIQPISTNHTTVVTPIIESINDTTFRYNPIKSDSLSVGGFDWNLQFTWHVVPEREKKNQKSITDPVRTPTMAGGLFAIKKDYFNYLGTYDDGMEIWGGENLEISFRIWMCGGTLVTSTCSHVGHIFRKKSPYQWLPGVNVIKNNGIRVAEVWLDEYKEYYYDRINYDLTGYGDVTQRKQLREELKCKSFKWYLTEIYPELSLPDDAIASGEIRNPSSGFCLDANVPGDTINIPVIGYSCHRQGGNQYFMLSAKGEIRRDDKCVYYSSDQADAYKVDKVIVVKCDINQEKQRWTYNEKNQLYHQSSQLCLAISFKQTYVQMEKCNERNMRQKWAWKRRSINRTNRRR